MINYSNFQVANYLHYIEYSTQLQSIVIKLESDTWCQFGEIPA